MDCSLPDSSVHGIFQQEYWSGFTCPSPGDLSDPGTEPETPIGRQILYPCATWEDLGVQSISCKMPGWMNHKLESRFLGEISTTSDTHTLKAENEEKLKNLLIRVKEESEKAVLKPNI